MQPLYDFGISQEDPLTEYSVLEIQAQDHGLCVASGGEVPLTILVLQPGVKITAVDISANQLMLCRLKMKTAITLPFPDNGKFLGYAKADAAWRRRTYIAHIEPTLAAEDRHFWSQQQKAIEMGVVNAGRFEGYIKIMRRVLKLIIGTRQIKALLASRSIQEQKDVFDKNIATRQAVKYLFRIAFHPTIYKNRGLNAQGLIHAKTNTGEVFFSKFRSFCTATPVSSNYFLHYFLTGDCAEESTLPEFLHKKNRFILQQHHQDITWKNIPLEDELASQVPGTFTKIHLSNIGDWMSDTAFTLLLETIILKNTRKEKLCYRFLQKNHLAGREEICDLLNIWVKQADKTDRFPFYSVISIQSHG